MRHFYYLVESHNSILQWHSEFIFFKMTVKLVVKDKTKSSKNFNFLAYITPTSSS